MTCYCIVCGCQLWGYSNELDGRELSVCSLDFMKSSVVFEFIVQLLVINGLKYLKIKFYCSYLQTNLVAPLRLLGSSRFHADFT